jgi:hypothetical protein
MQSPILNHPPTCPPYPPPGSFIIQLLPAAVVAPLFFQGKIDFGVINQSQSAFNHILSDVSLVVYQFESLAGFSAVIDRLGEFSEVSDVKLRHVFTIEGESGAAAAKVGEGAAVAAAAAAAAAPAGRRTAASTEAAAEAGPGGITIMHMGPVAGGGGKGELLLELRGLCISTPDGSSKLAHDLNLEVWRV